MRSTPSPQIRILAVLALILFAGGGAYLLIHSSSGSDTKSTSVPTVTSHTTTKTSTTNSKPEKKKSKKTVEGVAALDAALVNRPIVVVSVYARNVALDVAAMEEARAGAARAGAGFVAFNIYDEKLARQLGGLVSDSQMASPGVLFFKRPRTLAFALHGFSDSQVVAQAAQNVLPHEEPWVGEANLVCSRFATSLAKAQMEATSADINTAAGRKQAAAALERAATLLNREVKALGKVRANSSKVAKFAQIVTDLKQVSANMSSEASALRGNDSTTAKAIDQKNATLIATVTTLASELQLTTCAS